MEEVLTIRVPKGTRRKLEQRAKAEHLSLSQYVRRALEAEQLAGALEVARRDLVPRARAKGLYTDDDIFNIVS
jgi:predicted transcriptional regulator